MGHCQLSLCLHLVMTRPQIRKQAVDVVFVGAQRALGIAVHNDKVAERHSALAERLRG